MSEEREALGALFVRCGVLLAVLALIGANSRFGVGDAAGDHHAHPSSAGPPEAAAAAAAELAHAHAAHESHHEHVHRFLRR